MIQVTEILEYLKKRDIEHHYVGDEKTTIEYFSSLNNYKKNTITWCRDRTFIPAELPIEKITLLISADKIYKGSTNIIYVKDARRVFFEIVENFFAKEEIEDNYRNYSYIGAHVSIGKNSKIGNNCNIDGNIVIGDNVIIGNNVTIINKATIGDNCHIQSGAVIGENGFSYSEIDGQKMMIKHYGGVHMGDNVHIGANTCIARGTIDDTCIGSGSKIDNLCHIAHNVVIGNNVTLIAGTLVYGSVKIGDNSYIASATIRDQCQLGNNIFVGMGSVVTKDIMDNEKVVGVPAHKFNGRK